MLVLKNLYSPNWTYYRFSKDFKAIYKMLWKCLKIKDDRELSLVFVSNNKIKKLNSKYRNQNKATDVLSFGFDHNKSKIKSPLLGEIFISVEKVKSQAKAYNHSQRREICFLFLHGLLHILGYDHKNSKQEKEMFSLQNMILEKTNIRR